MARKRIDDEGLLDALLGLFREQGVEGVTLQEISKATGLEKASLYYRFAGGKEEMVTAVLGHVSKRIGEAVIGPLMRREDDPAKRLRQAIKGMRVFYHDGASSCVLDTMSLRRGGDSQVRGAAELLVIAFQTLAEDAGAGRMAGRKAEEALVRVEGSLVLARALGNPEIFQRALKDLPNLLLG